MQQDTVAGQRRWQLIVAVCVLSNFADGYDIMAAAFAGPMVSADFNMPPSQLGLLFGAGLAGMTLGSLFIAPLADRLARRRVALGCMAMMTVGMLLSAAAASPWMLIGFRLFTGLGIGGMLPILNTIVAEVAPAHRRNLAVSLLSIGYPLGSTAGGVLAIALTEQYGWQSIFLVGGCVTLAIFILQLAFLPKSIVPPKHVGVPPAPSARGSHRHNLITVSAAFFLNMICFFFILNWTPKLVEELGLSARVGITATVVLNLAGLAGGLAYGVLADRFTWRRVAQAVFVAFALTTAMFGLVPADATLVLVAAGAIGLVMAAAMTSLYAMAPIAFPPRFRAGGTGFAIGIGRMGGTLGPILAGYALAAGIDRALLYLLFAAFPLMVTPFLQRVRENPMIEAGTDERGPRPTQGGQA